MMSGATIDPILALAVRLLLSAVFATAAAHKISDRRRFRQTLADYRLLPAPLLPAAAIALTAAEILTAVALLVPVLAWAGLTLATVLLLLYALAIAVNLRRGRRSIDCGCTGFASGQPISGGLVARNGFLAALAVGALLPTGGRVLSTPDYGVAFATAVAGLLLYAAVNQLLANAPGLALLRARYE
jgi:uncharacterized membrane protein YphA (DoxX/SURF4 family)